MIESEEISVVVQGPLNEFNCVPVEYYLAHWRRILPRAQIVLSCSTADFDGVIAEKDLRTAKPKSPVARASILRICQLADDIVLCNEAGPLPPLKFDDKLNNINLQLSAAKAGLRAANRTYVLRIRNDSVFYDLSFIEQFFEGRKYARGTEAILQDRILISDIFTLDPYSIERLPYHFSDWFHFGLTTDVRDYWNADAYQWAEATFYQFHPLASHSNSKEQQFRSRYAVEQFIALSWLQRTGRPAKLEYHNDLSDRYRSLGVLRDNFVICDTLAARYDFPKYAQSFRSGTVKLLCMSRLEWQQLAVSPDVGTYLKTQKNKHGRARIYLLLHRWPLATSLLRVARSLAALIRPSRRHA